MAQSNTATLHSWHHADYADAAKEIWDAVGDLDGVEVFQHQVLTACYVRPVKTRGGLITIAKTQFEDVFQGKVSMILKIGPDAFRPSEADLYNGRPPAVGEWVFSRVQDCFQMSIKGPGGVINREDGGQREWAGWPCRLIAGQDIYGRVQQPHVLV